jgi:gliding motility-associated-like protein
MKGIRILLYVLAVLIGGGASGQNCTQLGQNPGTAFPVCGISVFTQTQVPICGNHIVPTPCEGYADKNPFWYKFTCHTSGTLGLVITPADLGDDYDWQLFDITNESPGAVFTKTSLYVASNWSGEYGVTGASSDGTSKTVCGGKGQALFSKMPDIIEGHEYLLLISHFTDSQSGYTLAFGGGTADITDPKIPAMTRATAACSGTELYVKLNKEIKCASIASDGSDFSLPSGMANIIGATSGLCSDAFTTDTLVLTLDHPLPDGDYAVNVSIGSDANSLLDNCDNNVPDGTLNFTVHENVSAQFNYVLREGCDRDTIEVSHDGAHHVHTWNWDLGGASSTNQGTSIVFNKSGDKNVTLTVSNDFCTDSHSETVAIAPQLDAKFSGPELWCAVDNVNLVDHSAGNITNWKWDFGNGSTSTRQNPDPFKYTALPGEKNYIVNLTISNAIGCLDTASANITVVGNCNIVVPTAFTPNNDGKNDYLFPTNAFGAENLIFRVYNRFGQVIFESKDSQKKWDGNVYGQPQSNGTYVWTLSYTLRANGRHYFFKGTTVLIR